MKAAAVYQSAASFHKVDRILLVPKAPPDSLAKFDSGRLIFSLNYTMLL